MISLLRYTLTERWKLFTIVFSVSGVILLLIGGYFLLSPGQTQVVSDQETTAEFTIGSTYSGEVGDDSEVWESGTVLRENSLYLYNDTSTIDFNTTITVDQMEHGELIFHQDAKLVQRAIVSGNVVWTREEMVMSNQQEFSDTGSQDGIEFELDAIDTREELMGVESNLGELATIETVIEIENSYAIDGERQDMDEILYSVQFSETSYFISTEESRVSETRTEQVTTEEEINVVGPEFISLFIISGILFIVSSVGTIVYHHNVDSDKVHREYLYDKFGEWISTGDMYIDAEKNYICMNDAQSVIDMAIDSNRRVIYKDSLHIYMVSVDDQIYYYSYEDVGVEKWVKSLQSE